MNIIIINHYAGSPKMGMEYRPYYMARQWVKQGHEVSIIASTESHIRKLNPTVKYDFQEEMLDGVRYVWVKTPKYQANGAKRVFNMLSFTAKLWMNALRLSKLYHPDVVIASSTYTIDNYSALKIARISKAKYYYEIHDLWPLSPMELGGMSAKHPFIRLMQYGENYAYRWADKVISMLPNTQEHTREHGLDLKKWRYIPNGICLEEWEQSYLPDNDLKKKINGFKAKGSKLIAYTGTLGLANALNNLVDAADLLKEYNYEFLIFGIGPEEENLKNEITKRELRNIHMMGSVPKSSIPGLLASMDLLYIGLQRQSLFRFGISPNKLIDYMMAAKPIVQAIDAGNDMVAEADCGLSVEPENPQLLANAIRDLMGREEEDLLVLGNNGREFALKNHTYKELAQQFLNIMEE